MSVEFDSPANRIIQQLQPKNQFGIKTSLADISFLRQLSIQGRLRYNFLSTTATQTLTVTPNVGETRFFYKVIFNMRTSSSWQFTIANNGITRSTINLSTDGTLVSKEFTYDLFDSLVGDNTKTFTIIATEVGGAARATVTLLGWSENTSRIRDVTT